MTTFHRSFVGRLAAAFALLSLASCTAVTVPKPQKGQPSLPPAQALERLKEGNARFVKGGLARKPSPGAQRANLAEGQAPFAVIVGCSDSRTAPELVFDKPLGGLFVVRCAGNLVDRYGMGSIEYAVEHLGARLVVVLGHQRCGAVAAAMDGGHAPGHIGDLLEEIHPAVQATKGQPGDPLQNAIIENARRIAAQVRTSRPDLKSLAHGEEVIVLPACYDLENGVVTWLE